MTKSGYVTIYGKPNAGKSTLINGLLNFNLSIANKKVQTTRDRILGILTEDDYQMIFIDTPGILEPKYELQRFMLSEIKTSLEEADVLVHIVDINRADMDELRKVDAEFAKLTGDKKKILALNKIDLIDKEKLLPLIDKLQKEFSYNEIIPISAADRLNVDTLKSAILKYLPEGPMYYDKDTVTTRPEKFFVSEIIREKILSMYHEEIPYSVMINIAEFKERDNGVVYINADIVLERETQKMIVIGKKGEGLKRLGERARKEIERFLSTKVYLELFVKVRKDWRNNKKFIKDAASNYNQS